MGLVLLWGQEPLEINTAGLGLVAMLGLRVASPSLCMSVPHTSPPLWVRDDCRSQPIKYPRVLERGLRTGALQSQHRWSAVTLAGTAHPADLPYRHLRQLWKHQEMGV